MPRYPSDYEECVQLIQPDGTYDHAAVEAVDIDDETLQSIYETIIQTRALDERGQILQRQGEFHFWMGCRGEEASYVAPAAAMAPNDWLQSDWRQYGLHIQRGRALLDIYLFWLRGYESWDDEPAQQNPPPALRRLPHTVAVGTTIPQAVGMLWGQKYQGHDDVGLVQFGDGATSKGDFHEGLNFAGILDIPVVFLVVNNQWAISVPVEQQTAARTYTDKAPGYGFDGILVDGNDPLAVYHVTKQAIEHARTDHEPTLIETLTYRLSAHSTSDDPSIYRDEADVDAWRDRDPITRYETFLEDQGLWSPAYRDDLRDTADERARAAADKALKIAHDQPPDELFDEVYANPPPALRAQADELAALIDTHGHDIFREA